MYKGESLTYAELNQVPISWRVTCERKGIGPDQLVGLCIERSLDMVVGILAIIKAAGRTCLLIQPTPQSTPLRPQRRETRSHPDTAAPPVPLA